MSDIYEKLKTKQEQIKNDLLDEIKRQGTTNVELCKILNMSQKSYDFIISNPWNLSDCFVIAEGLNCELEVHLLRYPTREDD